MTRGQAAAAYLGLESAEEEWLHDTLGVRNPVHLVPRPGHIKQFGQL